MAEGGDEAVIKFLHVKHIKYCLRSLDVLPKCCDELDSIRMVTAFFTLSTLDLLNATHNIREINDKFINWIYYLQVTTQMNTSKKIKCGFRGSTSCTVTHNNELDLEFYDKPHLAMTYAALVSLVILGDDLERVDRKGIICALKELQLSDGSFRPMNTECENDMRFVYCAACISYILHDWSGMDIDKAVKYIQESITYEGGIAQGPGLEAHGGSTFCAIASLWLMGRLQSALDFDQMNRLKRWCLLRQTDNNESAFQGFQGRPNKSIDTCYSFWIGATLSLLNCFEYFNHEEVKKFILTCQDDVVGGIKRWAANVPDPLHTYLGISGLSLMKCENLLPVHPALNMSERAFEHLRNLHQSWEKQGIIN